MSYIRNVTYSFSNKILNDYMFSFLHTGNFFCDQSNLSFYSYSVIQVTGTLTPTKPCRRSTEIWWLELCKRRRRRKSRTGGRCWKMCTARCLPGYSEYCSCQRYYIIILVISIIIITTE